MKNEQRDHFGKIVDNSGRLRGCGCSNRSSCGGRQQLAEQASERHDVEGFDYASVSFEVGVEINFRRR